MFDSIDIIVPVFNTPYEDLDRLFKSFIAQTIDKWQVIIVDDGSDVTTSQWLDQYIDENPKFKIIHTPNQGVSKARNTGLDISNGDFVVFCDADDMITPEFLEDALYYMKEYDLDIVIGGVKCLKKFNGNKEIYYQSKSDLLIYEKRDICKLLAYMLAPHHTRDNRDLGNAWTGRAIAKMFRGEIARAISFPCEIKMHEDNLYSFDTVKACKRIAVVNKTWYINIHNNYSSTKTTSYIDGIRHEIRFINTFYREYDYYVSFGLKNEFWIREFDHYCILMKILAVKVADDKKRKKYIFSIHKNKIIEEVKRNIDLKGYQLSEKKNLFFYILIKLCGNNQVVYNEILQLLLYVINRLWKLKKM